MRKISIVAENEPASVTEGVRSFITSALAYLAEDRRAFDGLRRPAAAHGCRGDGGPAR